MSLPRLSSRALPAGVRRPSWDRAATPVRTAHLGVGAFHRCHGAEFLEDALEAGEDAGGIVGINLRPPALRDLLAPQDGLYLRTLRDAAGEESRVVGAILRVADAGADPEEALRWLASPGVTTATLTVTEKGYCHVPATGEPDWSNPDLIADARGGTRSAPGLLLAALRRRRESGAGAINLVSCDNVAGNGGVLRAVVRGLAAEADPGMLPWLDDHVAFPDTVVDRIVPAVDPADLDALARRIGVRDEAAVWGEPFRQWVIADDFRAPRPPWEAAGAEVVADPFPFEAAKMRLLNAAQTMLSLLGALFGHRLSWEAAADPALAAFARGTLGRETVPHLPPGGPEGRAYLGLSLARVGNRAVRHPCHQIATDTSRKLRQRVLDPLRERRRRDLPAPGLETAIGAWVAYLAAEAPAHGARWTVSDPVTEASRPLLARRGGDVEGFARDVLGIEAVLGADLGRDGALAARVGRAARRLLAGDRGALTQGLDGTGGEGAP